MKLFSNTISLLETSLDYSTVKQKVISHNIANVDTPNYKARDVKFKAILDEKMNGSFKANLTNEKHIPISPTTSNPIVTTEPNVQYNHNGNSVDVDLEMVKLAQNQIYYNAIVDRLNGKFQTLQSVIKGGSQ
ncbi:flagellar basal body rod protein FlgB [Fervidibacillus halotolerans]|uniref:Flagellar basal body rod protein FlgB n=1 Tax=Fervidibacillus halotolerans TaxID=2980027 RepID=A0A9E8M1N3_9BACI|nr:flagellar basal body rod protein FlgB [Fervidibacillus halotolerans]WAA13609.1 flagellar basal body rod protein FlgB [Fervidibacillus halotolerans]